MTRYEIIEKMLDKGLSYKRATEQADAITEKARYLTRVFGREIKPEDVIEELENKGFNFNTMEV